MSKKFEYKTGHNNNFAMTEAQLNELGAQGWELVEVIGNMFYFKREGGIEVSVAVAENQTPEIEERKEIAYFVDNDKKPKRQSKK